ncbi:Glycosyl transferase, family 4, conserved region [Denitrovibrio acetiphilus DSM 12809]|uniref:Glycosyl transferase, family 4, conserved region n=1 Tax=Denitrovibrio acetiphilus (strain DSM 12809 / NBRC 114555 / N2460) TaxID=522772 RepID=D4H5T3_DENA2|nr:MraY family glycosyltransferase [Denitrovibrio acetiphilus]ADD69524.1 Glycosyl transferase, family 4, conserved region [Denitrovibrio acetiphilus DSM 12809]
MLLIYMLTGFAVSLITVPFITALAAKAQIVDVPCERKIHIDNIPLLGGLGIFAAYIIVILTIDSFSAKTYALIAANVIIIITGMFDDVFSLNAPKKLIGQVAAAVVIILFTDFRFTISSFDYAFLSYPMVNIAFTLLWVVGVTNALNLVDGMDGLAGGIAFMAFGAMSYAAYSKGYDFNAYVCMGLMGATLGFLRYNIPPAKVFMGDTGSLFLGFNIAVMSIGTSHKSGTVLSVLIPIMFISLPLFDTMLAIVRRAMKGKNPMKADKEHLHHRLLSLEFSSVQTLMIFYSLSILLIAISIFSFQKQFIWGAIIILMLLYIFFLVLKLFHLFDAGKKIRSLNEKMRRTAVIISKHNMEYDIRTQLLDIVIMLASSAMITKFIWHEILINYTQLAAAIAFCISMFAVLTYKRVSHIKNQFVSFGFFWFFFYMVFISYKSSFTAFDFTCLTVLFVCIIFKILIQKQIDLFVSNPMELIMFFCLILIYLFTKAPAADFLAISAFAFILYYANKFYFNAKSALNISYTVVLSVFLIIFTISSSMSIVNSDSGGTPVALTPAQIKSLLKDYTRNGEYEKAHQLLLAYEDKRPFTIMKAYYKGEGAKLYSNLVLDALLAGDLALSNTYLNEFLTIFPDMVEEFYVTVAPILTRVSKLNIRGAGDIHIAGISIDQISKTYSETLFAMSSRYEHKGFDKRSHSYSEIAMLLEDIGKSAK